jgi:hypothetical protein
MYRKKNILFYIWVSILLMVAGNSYAQHVLIPNPQWPLDSVVNRSVHFYTVPGDPNYADSSTFVWNVYGGRLFYDADTLHLAGNGRTAIDYGDRDNITRMWVVWNINTQLDTGYVYVYEISADSCQRSDLDEGKYQGMRIKISAPPKARFIGNEFVACSNFDSARVIMEIEGMPPYDLVYSVNGEVHNLHIISSDLTDLDNDGEKDNISFFYPNLSSYVNDSVYVYEILDISSGGVPGKILPSSTFDLIVHVQPPAPVILTEWTEVTAGYDYTYHLQNPGVNPVQWNWTLRDFSTNLVNERGFKPDPTFQCFYNSSAIPGKYYLESQYIDSYGCLSPQGRLDVELFGMPTIAFSDSSPNLMNCSATVPFGSETFEFYVKYTGATTYSFTYEVYDYKGTLVGSDGGVFNNLSNRTNIISIPNNFVNDVIPEQIRPWKVVITTARTEDGRVNVNILDSDIPGGRDERTIMIYPKPIIHDDIDFAN